MKNIDIIRTETAKAIETKIIKAGQELNTYNGWTKAGCQVKRGAKAKVTVALWTKKNGEFIKVKTALFSTSQVTKAQEPEPLRADDPIITEMETETKAETERTAALYDRNGNAFNPNDLPEIITVHSDYGKRKEEFKFKLEFFPTNKKAMSMILDTINSAKDADYIKAVLIQHLTTQMELADKLKNSVRYNKCKSNILMFDPEHKFENETEHPVMATRKTGFMKLIVGKNGERLQVPDMGYHVSFRGYEFYIHKAGSRWYATEKKSGIGCVAGGASRTEVLRLIGELNFSTLAKLDFNKLETARKAAPVKEQYVA